MTGNSRIVFSAQTEAHRDLEKLVKRHMATPFRKPVLDMNRAAFSLAMAEYRRNQVDMPLILDSGCGIGLSTFKLAEQFEDHFVIGVDQSSDRLSRKKAMPQPKNMVLVRADLVDFWRLLVEENHRLAKHYVLYPNPWPKIGHLARRWHGHPVFPFWPQLGGILECRSNWSIYIEEMSQALTLLLGKSVMPEKWQTNEPMTPFEKKYLASGHELWRCKVVFE